MHSRRNPLVVSALFLLLNSLGARAHGAPADSLLVANASTTASPVLESVVTPDLQHSSARVAFDPWRGLPPGLEFGVTADAYAGHQIGGAPDPLARLRAFDGRQSEVLGGYAEIYVQRLPDARTPFGVRVDAGTGPTARLVGSFDRAGRMNPYVQQAYVSLRAPLGRGLQVDAGKFVTPFGVEVIEARDNWQYSRGLLFTWAIPFYHAGVRTKLPVHDRVTLTAEAVRGWNNTVDSNGGVSLGGGASVTLSSAASLTAHVMAGPEQAGSSDGRVLAELLGAWTPAAPLAFAAELDWGRERRGALAMEDALWQGVALFARWQCLPRAALSLRAESLEDTGGFATGTSQIVRSLTLTQEMRLLPALVARTEYRLDRSTVESFDRDGSPSRDQSTLALGLVFGWTRAAESR